LSSRRRHPSPLSQGGLPPLDPALAPTPGTAASALRAAAEAAVKGRSRDGLLRDARVAGLLEALRVMPARGGDVGSGAEPSSPADPALLSPASAVDALVGLGALRPVAGAWDEILDGLLQVGKRVGGEWWRRLLRAARRPLATPCPP
jgi:hypothetical protein